MAKEVHIPDGIIVDVLSKLPSNSLLRFRIVCKAWYFLISDPKFIEFHSQRTSQNPKLIFSTAGSTIRLLDSESPSFDHSSSSLSLPLNFPEETSSLRIVGSSCGLVCVATDYSNVVTDDSNVRFSVWNPVTRECRELPEISWPRDKHNEYLHGFGYDSVTNDFILVICYYRYGYFMYSLKEECWVVAMGTLPYDIPKSLEPKIRLRSMTRPATTLATVLNGSFHWLVLPGFDDPCIPQIIAFNCAEKEFQKLEMPAFVSLASTSVVSLLEHRGCLCLYFSDYRSEKDVKEIWMMKEYGDITSWVHLLTIENSESPASVLNFCPAPILCISTRNEVVLYNGEMFIRSRREDDKFDGMPMQPYVNGAALYVDSLVSVPYPIDADDGL